MKTRKGNEKTLWSKPFLNTIYYYFSNTFYHSAFTTGPFLGRRWQGQNRCKAGSLCNVDSFLIKCISVGVSGSSLNYQTTLSFSQLCPSCRWSLLLCGSKRAVPGPIPFLWLILCSHRKEIWVGKYKHHKVSAEWLWKGSTPTPTSL